MRKCLLMGTRIGLRLFLDLHVIICKLLKKFTGTRHCKKEATEAKTILLTGTFHNDGWILNKLRPMVGCKYIKKIVLVSSYEFSPPDKVHLVSPSRILKRIVGETPARLLLFTFLAIKYRPEFVGGFHLLLNGLTAILVARMVGTKSIYFNGGGFREFIDGGYLSFNVWTKLIGGPDKSIERRLLRVVNECDVVITRGEKIIRYFRENNIKAQCEVVAGGIEIRCKPEECVEKKFDLIFIGRLVKVKRLDIFLDVVKQIKQKNYSINACIVGAGELQMELKEKVNSMNLDNTITFAGYQSEVVPYLAKSKIILLPSDSEGLSQALLEAMICGVPGVVSDVGEHADVIEHGKNGFLIQRQDSEEYVKYVSSLLSDYALWKAVSEEARKSSEKYGLSHSVEKWCAICQ